MKRVFEALVLPAAFIVPPVLAAESYPERPVRFIVPFPPGGGTDAFARIVGVKLTEIWGQQIIVDNRSGAQGNIGTALGAKATPDGYTLTPSPLFYLDSMTHTPAQSSGGGSCSNCAQRST